MFDAAVDKQKKIQQKRQQEAKKRKLEQERQKSRMDALEKEREEQKLLETRSPIYLTPCLELQEKRREEEKFAHQYQKAGGVLYSRNKLKVVPDPIDSDRIFLPPSAFEELNKQNVFDNNVFSGSSNVLTFEVEAVYERVDPKTGKKLFPLFVSTHCGVSEFSAEEGTVKFGPKVLFSLLDKMNIAIEENCDLQNNIFRKNNSSPAPMEGVESSSANNNEPSSSSKDTETISNITHVNVRFLRLPQRQRCKCTFQPKGTGFFANDEKVVVLDIKSVLEKQLHTHVCLTEGDVIPVRGDENHPDKTFYLVARALEPDEALLLLNTEMEIAVLPSESTEYDEKLAKFNAEREAKLKKKRDDEVSRREQFLKSDKNEEISETEAANTSNIRLIEVQVKLPSGKSVNRKFPINVNIEKLFEFLNSHPDTMDLTYDLKTKSNKSLKYLFELVQSWPGHRKVFNSDIFTASKSDEENLSFDKQGLNGRREQLYFKTIGADDNEADIEKHSDKNDNTRPQTSTNSENLGSPGDNLERADSAVIVKPEKPKSLVLSAEWQAVADQSYKKIDEKINDNGSFGVGTIGDAAGMGGEAASADSVTVFNLLVTVSLEQYKSENSIAASSSEEDVPMPDADNENDASPSIVQKNAEKRKYSQEELAQFAKKWSNQLTQLSDLGFGPEVWLTKCIPLLEKYHGTVVRVASALVEGE